MGTGPPWRVALLVLLCALWLPPLHALGAPAGQPAGATLTVLRGAAAIRTADGTPRSPAASGTVLGVGDQVATLARSGALVTFFEGSEVELGAETTIIVRQLASNGASTTITLESVVGSTVHRVVTVTTSGSAYRVEAGGTVALVRGTVFGHGVDAGGDVTAAVVDGEIEFPRAGLRLRRGERRTATARGDVETDRFDPALSPFTAVAAPVASGNPSGTDNPGLGTGSQAVPEQGGRSDTDGADDRPTRVPSTPGRTVLTADAPAGSTRLEVASVEGFAVGDPIVIGSGTSAERNAVAGFGSMLLARPLVGAFRAGDPVVLAGAGEATPTPIEPTLGVSEATPTRSPTRTSTAVTLGTSTPTSATPTPIGTPITTASATGTPSATPTETGTPTATPTVTPTPSMTPTATLLPVSWVSFEFGEAGSQTTPFAFSHDGPSVLRVTDTACRGDRFQVLDNGVSLGATSSVPIRPCSSEGSTSNPNEAYGRPDYSHAAFSLAPGHHAIVIVALTSPFGGGSGALRVDPMP